MKKIISILISLLLLANAFGVGTVMAGSISVDLRNSVGIVNGADTVQIGAVRNLFIRFYVPAHDSKNFSWEVVPDNPDLVKLLDDPNPWKGSHYFTEGQHFRILTFEALAPGTVEFTGTVRWSSGDFDVDTAIGPVTVTILGEDGNCNGVTEPPVKRLPMHQFMKILGIGGLMRE